MTIVTVFLGINSQVIIESSLLCQIILVASAFTFFKFAFVNKYELEKTSQMLNLLVCSTLADIMIMLWLHFFSPSKVFDLNLIIAYIVVILIVKGFIYVVTYIDGQKQAKQLNEKLSMYRNDENE